MNRIACVSLEDAWLGDEGDLVRAVILVELESGHFARLNVIMERAASDGALCKPVAVADWIGPVKFGDLDVGPGVAWLLDHGSSPEALAAELEARRWGALSGKPVRQ